MHRYFKSMSEEIKDNNPEMPGEGRDEKTGRFLPGFSGNPKGMEAGKSLQLASLLKAKLIEVPDGEKGTYAEKFIKTLIDKALIENDIKALKLIINYTDGLPSQYIEANVNLYKLNIVRAGDTPDNKNNKENKNGTDDTTPPLPG